MPLFVTCRSTSIKNAFISAIQCDGAVLPNFSGSVAVTSHSGLFSYSSTVAYTCLTGQRFEDGNAHVVVTCAGIGVWDWNPVVTSCGREFVSYTRSKSYLRSFTNIHSLIHSFVSDTSP